MTSQNDCQFVQKELSIKQPVDYSAIIVECMQYNNEFQEHLIKKGAAPFPIHRLSLHINEKQAHFKMNPRTVTV